MLFHSAAGQRFAIRGSAAELLDPLPTAYKLPHLHNAGMAALACGEVTTQATIAGAPWHECDKAAPARRAGLLRCGGDAPPQSFFFFRGVSPAFSFAACALGFGP